MRRPEKAGTRLVEHASTRLLDREGSIDLADLNGGTSLSGAAASLAGLSVLIATRTQSLGAVALVELDGLVRRLTIAPPDLKPDHLDAVLEDAEIECIVTDQPERFAEAASRLAIVPLALPIVAEEPPPRDQDTEWVLLTSGTSGRPKMVVHTLAGLTGAIHPPLREARGRGTTRSVVEGEAGASSPAQRSEAGEGDHPRGGGGGYTSARLRRDATLETFKAAAAPSTASGGPPPLLHGGGSRSVWATFYDIRRYGGLQIFLRAILGGTDLVLTSPDEPLGEHLHRLGAEGVTSISGTPSHWRRVLMSHERGAMAPRYIRLSGEIADQTVLDGLRAAYPDAAIGHAYASTEAGVGFSVDDGREGFPIAMTKGPHGGVEMKIVDGSLCIRSMRAATRYLGPEAPALADADGFVDTGDLVEQRGDRWVFVGRRGGIINVGGLKVNPEEVEAAINSHAEVRMSLVQARKNPLTGAIVVADVVLRHPQGGTDILKTEILENCRSRLERHKVPAILRFVPELALTSGGKLSRAPAVRQA